MLIPSLKLHRNLPNQNVIKYSAILVYAVIKNFSCSRPFRFWLIVGIITWLNVLFVIFLIFKPGHTDKYFANKSSLFRIYKSPKLRSSLSKSTLSSESSLPPSIYPKTGVVKAPAVILKVKGGLGNQLFQYACSYSISRKHNWPLYIAADSKSREDPKIEESDLNSNSNLSLLLNKMFKLRNSPEAREFVLNHFNIPIKFLNTITPNWTISSAITYIKDSDLLFPGHFSEDKIVQLSSKDYCQSETFFAPYSDEIRKLFTLKEMDRLSAKRWTARIKSSNDPVAVHVRLGDFIKLKNAVPIHYYQHAMRKLSQMLKKQNRTATFFIFSDDIQYVKEKLFEFGEDDQFRNLFDVHFVSESDSDSGVVTSIQDFGLMVQCKHAIIGNSSFGWWAAYLIQNREKIVISVTYNLSGIVNKYFRWQYKYLYYPVSWFQYEVFVGS